MRIVYEVTINESYRATQMALDYQFVTPFTSMIVVANDTTNNPPPITTKPVDPNYNPGTLTQYSSGASGHYQPMTFSCFISVLVVAALLMAT